MKATSLPDHMIRCIDPAERKKLKLKTAEEAIATAQAKSEKELQGQIVNLLRLRGIEVLWHRTDKKSHATVGWTDLTFAVLGHDGHSHRVYACAVEVKLPGKYLDEKQRNMRKAMTASPNHWTHRTIYSVDEMRTFLEGLAVDGTGVSKGV